MKFPPSQGRLVKFWLALGRLIVPRLQLGNSAAQEFAEWREEKREKGHNETWPDPQRQAEGSFKEHGSILKIMNRLNLRADKERSLDFGKWLLGFLIVSTDVRLEAR